MTEYLETTSDKFTFRVKKGIHYHKEECWLEVREDVGLIGITDFLQITSGDVSFFELPEPGSMVKADEKFGVMETIKAVIDLVSPAGGEVTEVNPLAADAPEKANEDPYGEAWLIKIKVDAAFNASAQLMSDEAYFSFMKEKLARQG